ncbi:lipoprotein [Psychrobacter urativorans]|uniref:LptM family lipoprotein n=1 Tax=Psychrobacter urativorans TaxID=45610 RepID=UPI00191817B1|nr:lipoprotein [Psychrobacter urativorans]
MLITPQLADNYGTQLSIDNTQTNDIGFDNADNIASIRVPTLITKARYRIIGTLLIGGAVIIGITGCGQKGTLYLAGSSGPNVTSDVASEVLDSTSNPQDAAFAGIDDDDYQKTRYLEQKQVLPDISDGPNDY